MSSRLKRRSSIGFPGANRQNDTTQSDEAEDSVDEEAERRARNLQRKQLQQQPRHLDSPASSQEKGNSRRSTGGLSGLSATQLAEHYNNCIKLSAENKINTKNAFNLQLIDYMASMIKKKDMSNFQVAAGTLDASTKIYAYRVDAVYGDTLKIASGLGQSTKQDNEKEGDGDHSQDDQDELNNPDKKVRKRIKRSTTVEKNLKNLNVNKFELEFDVDPLFKKTSSQFDGAAGGNQFLSTLEIRDETGELLLDSEAQLHSNIMDWSPTKGSVDGGEVEMMPMPSLESMAICSTFSQFSFTTWSLDSDDDDEYNRLNESISLSQEERCKGQGESEQEHAFDALAIPEPVDDGGMFDEGGVDADYDDDPCDVSERALGHVASAPNQRGFTANLPMTTSDMLAALTTAPLEYSYFDQGKLGAWAGPKHWKFKPLSRINADGDKAKGRKKKEIQPLGFEDYEKEDEEDERIEKLLSKPKKPIRLVEKTMKGWEKRTLPEDLHYSGHELVRLKVCDQIVVSGRKSAAETQVDDVEDYDYDNPADRDDYCPDVDDDQDAYGGQSSLLNNSHETDSQSSLSRLDTQGDYAGDDLVEAPKMVDKAALQIGYAKTAKKVDMKRIKSVTWSILTQASNEDKENVGASPEKVSEKAEGGGKVEETSFSHIFRLLKQPHRLPPKMTENLSVPLALLGILHLCNEENLEIVQDSTLQDFTIKQG